MAKGMNKEQGLELVDLALYSFIPLDGSFSLSFTLVLRNWQSQGMEMAGKQQQSLVPLVLATDLLSAEINPRSPVLTKGMNKGKGLDK